MFKKNQTTKKISKLTPKKPAPKTSTKPTKLIITEKLKQKVLPIIVSEFAQALKSLKAGQSIRFSRLGSFKKTKRTINGHIGYQYSFKAFSLLRK